MLCQRAAVHGLEPRRLRGHRLRDRSLDSDGRSLAVRLCVKTGEEPVRCQGDRRGGEFPLPDVRLTEAMDGGRQHEHPLARGKGQPLVPHDVHVEAQVRVHAEDVVPAAPAGTDARRQRQWAMLGFQLGEQHVAFVSRVHVEDGLAHLRHPAPVAGRPAFEPAFDGRQVGGGLVDAEERLLAQIPVARPVVAGTGQQVHSPLEIGFQIAEELWIVHVDASRKEGKKEGSPGSRSGASRASVRSSRQAAERR